MNKSPQEVDIARQVIVAEMNRPGLKPHQLNFLTGLSVALQWVAGSDPKNALQILLDRTMPMKRIIEQTTGHLPEQS